MNKVLSAVAISAVLATPVMAADMRMPVKAPPAPEPVAYGYNWTGFYIGAHAGGGWGDKCFTIIGFGDAGCHDLDGWLGGGQIGFNWQTNNLVLGIEFSGSAADLEGSHTAPPLLFPDVTISTKVNSIFLLTGRIGVTWDRVLIYANGGGAWVRDKYSYVDTLGGVTPTARETRTGWTAGAGVEFALTPNWSLAGQYNFVGLGEKTRTFSGGNATPFDADVDQDLHLATVRLNYRFGGFGGGPVVARY